MNFLVDAQLPPALARWLREAGHEAVQLQELGLREAEDNAIWERALRAGAAILTKDEDFAAKSLRSASGPVVVWLRVGNVKNRELRAWIEPRLPGIIRLMKLGDRLVEVI